MTQPSVPDSSTPPPAKVPGAPAVPAGRQSHLMRIRWAIAVALVGAVGLGGALAEAADARAALESERSGTRLFNERYAKAAEQLGSDKAAVRLAGVYALAGLADDWPSGRQTCIDVLCAYLRMPYTPPSDDTDDQA